MYLGALPSLRFGQNWPKTVLIALVRPQNSDQIALSVSER
jgi:hypothetical protein